MEVWRGGVDPVLTRTGLQAHQRNLWLQPPAFCKRLHALRATTMDQQLRVLGVDLCGCGRWGLLKAC